VRGAAWVQVQIPVNEKTKGSGAGEWRIPRPGLGGYGNARIPRSSRWLI